MTWREVSSKSRTRRMTLLKQTVGSWVLQGIQSVLYVFLFTAKQLPKIPGKPILNQKWDAIRQLSLNFLELIRKPYHCRPRIEKRPRFLPGLASCCSAARPTGCRRMCLGCKCSHLEWLMSKIVWEVSIVITLRPKLNENTNRAFAYHRPSSNKSRYHPSSFWAWKGAHRHS